MHGWAVHFLLFLSFRNWNQQFENLLSIAVYTCEHLLIQIRWQEPSELCFKKADSRQLCVKMLVHTAVWTALYALIWQKSALFKIFDLKDEDIGGDFCSSLLQVGWRPPKEKGRKAPQFTALRQVRIILVTLTIGAHQPIGNQKTDILS